MSRPRRASGAAGPAGPSRSGAASTALAATLCLLALAALVLLVAGGRTWAAALVHQPVGGTFTSQLRRAGGRSLSGVPTAAGVLALAGLAAVAATRGRGRWLLGGLLAVAGAAASWAAISHGLRPPRGLHSNGWPYAAAAGGLCELAGGLLMVRHGRAWPGLGRRFGVAEAVPSRVRPVSLWDALESGVDPTAAAGPGDPGGAPAAPAPR